MRMLTSCVDKLYYTPLFNGVYSVDHRISVDQRICWYESTPPKLPDETEAEVEVVERNLL